VQIVDGTAIYDGKTMLAGLSAPFTGQAWLYVRPQRITLTHDAHAALQGRVSAIRRHGPFKRLEIAVAGLGRPIEFDLLSDSPPACGEHVFLRIQDGHAFPA
jgi:ABC-type sulfate/molybdate transport systems ATPase subunit